MRVRFVTLAIVLLACVYTTHAQTTVTGTIHDPQGNPYANGTASAFLAVTSGQTQPPPTNVTTNAGGFFTMTLNAGSYAFTICAPPVELPPVAPTNNQTPRQICFISGAITISGGSQNLSVTLNAIAASLGVQGTSAGGVTNPSSIDGFIIVDGVTYLLTDVGIQNALASPGCLSQCVIIINGNVTISSTVTINKPVTLSFGIGTITSSVTPAFSITSSYVNITGVSNTETAFVPSSSSGVVFSISPAVSQPATQTTGAYYNHLSFSNFMCDGHAYNNINTAACITNPQPGSDTQIWDVAGVDVNNVVCNNVFNCVALNRAWHVKALNMKMYANSTFTCLEGQTTASFCNDVQIDNMNYTWQCYVFSACSIASISNAPIITFQGAQDIRITNSYAQLTGGATGEDWLQFKGGENFLIEGNTVENGRIDISIQPVTLNSVTLYSGYGKIHRNALDQIWGQTIQIADGTAAPPANAQWQFEISDNEITSSRVNGSTFVNIGKFTQQVVIDSNRFNNYTATTGVQFLVINDSTDYVRLSDNQMWNQGGGGTAAGIVITAGALGIYGVETTSFQAGITGNNPCCVFDSRIPVASAATITLPIGRSVVDISGNTAITTINTCSSSIPEVPNTPITLRFGASGAITKGNNIHINANFATVTDGTITIMCNGTNWLEVGRGVN